MSRPEVAAYRVEAFTNSGARRSHDEILLEIMRRVGA